MAEVAKAQKGKTPACSRTGLEVDPLRHLSLRPHPPSLNSVSETLASPVPSTAKCRGSQIVQAS